MEWSTVELLVFEDSVVEGAPVAVIPNRITIVCSLYELHETQQVRVVELLADIDWVMSAVLWLSTAPLKKLGLSKTALLIP